jgi:hypothetical protein
LALEIIKAISRFFKAPVAREVERDQGLESRAGI